MFRFKGDIEILGKKGLTLEQHNKMAAEIVDMCAKTWAMPSPYNPVLRRYAYTLCGKNETLRKT